MVNSVESAVSPHEIEQKITDNYELNIFQFGIIFIYFWIL